MTILEPFSVIIPAHNEAQVIERCLATMLQGMPEGAMEVIVACNGCSDDTASKAMGFGGAVRVIELEQGSKPLAINAANAVARHAVRLYADADILAPFAVLHAMALALSAPGTMTATPTFNLDLAASSWPVRAHYRVWLRLMEVLDNVVGSGIFGLSAKGRERIGELPAIISDDEYVRTRFAPKERRLISYDEAGGPVCVTVFPPCDLASLIRIESRQRAGLEQLRRHFPCPPPPRPVSLPAGLLATLSSGVKWHEIAVYLAIKVLARLHLAASRARGLENRWLRDDSSRCNVGPG